MISVLPLAILLAIFPLGQLGRLPLPLPGVVLQLNDLAVAVVVGGWVMRRLVKPTKFNWPPLTKPILAFIFVAIFSLLVNFGNFKIQELAVGGLYLLRWAAYAGLYFLVFDFLGGQKNISATIRKLTGWMMTAGMVVAILGLLQYFLYPNLRNLIYLGWDPHHFRVFGTFFDPNFIGIILVLTATLILVSLISEPFSWKTKWWQVLGLALVYLALALTYSRSSYLALVAGLLTLVLLKRNWRILGIFSVFTGILILVTLARLIFYAPTLSEKTASAQARIASWQQSLTIVYDHPLFGGGFNTYRFVQQRLGFLGKDDWSLTHAGGGTDASLLFVWATTGILGLGVYLWLWWKIIKSAISNQQSAISIILLASTAALFTHSLFVNSLFYPWVMEWLWILVGVAHVKDYK